MTSVDPLAARLAQLVKAPGQAPGTGEPPGADFEMMLKEAIRDTVATSRSAETTAAEHVLGEASVREVVEAVTQAEMGLQTASAVRDRVIAAYQDIIRMPI
ncbi:MAG: flagellar hook-basal body complex protein FliE [Alphaproteobacteria bacterium]|jgi:flagellar hook-basal body complex protein FliE|nr:flagellar hook-basal body complex protein FliE [Alphaproteobacteria bacterium]